MPSEKSCCVLKCGSSRQQSDIILHSFPNPEKDMFRFMAWFQAAGLDTSLDAHYVFKYRKICHIHFESKDLTWTKRLSPDAVPRLLLPGPKLFGNDNGPILAPTSKLKNVQLDFSTPSTLEVKEEILNRCRCCLDNVDLHLMWEEIPNNDQADSYGNMLIECFSLPWLTKNEGDQLEYICSSCVDRLQSALDFKKEIIASEQVLKGFLFQSDIQIEVFTEEDSIFANNDYIENVDIKTEVSEGEISALDKENSDQTDLGSTQKRKWPKKRKGADRLKAYKKYTQLDLREAIVSVRSENMTFKEACAEYNIPRNTLKSHLRKADIISEDHNVSCEDKSNKEKNFRRIEEIKMILKYTNAIPFKTKSAKYYCAYCSTSGPMFQDADELRIHTKFHEKERLEEVDHFMRPYWLNEILKLDVLNLTCTICNTKLPDWNQMFHHFDSQHGIEFDEAYTKVVPYNLSEPMQCVLCHDEFPNFHNLDGHMNAHYNNYICPTCGDTFVANSRLEKHLQVHHQGEFQCEECKRVFTLDKYRAKHYKLVHKRSTIRCILCPEVFNTVSEQNAHLVEHHKDNTNVYICEYCGRSYTHRKNFLKHLSRKKYKCEDCDKRFSSFKHLKTHKVICET
ncbi:zinc finger protein 43-like isoform X2 [Pieris brassicae]|uniref:zinc finger protein 43-like isoform X2 n=1 Tax=Pieris brassicae TaxID=7116 RepID=UPI001E65FBBA|nr:zinc finger protein 43-like isoform X2 [Pieris brassicae]